VRAADGRAGGARGAGGRRPAHAERARALLPGPPADPGVSRTHAVLIGRPESGWAVVDPGSENGTLVNDKEITTGVEVPLHDGDRISIGAWTVITIRRE
jgi:pSer/pThr/pTyr-binding forkhead associated (FHA) protein